MTEIVGLDALDTDKMIKLLDATNNNFLNYEDVVNMIMDSGYIEKFEKNLYGSKENFSGGSSLGDRHERVDEKFE